MKIILITSIVIGSISYICFNNNFFSIVLCANNFINKLINYTLPKEFDDDIQNQKLFSNEELSNFVGKNGKIYLSILGKVFDVTKGKKYYGPGESYYGFAGRDASKAFVTGDFSETGLTDDISDLALSDLTTLRDWVKLYEKDYIYKGKLIGRFYSESGTPTSYLKEIESKFLEADKLNEQNRNYNLHYPPCNTEWSQDKGSRVWCSNKSGGVKRSWVGVPRKLFMPGWSDYRCACIKPNSEQIINGGKLKFFDNCHPESESCFLGFNTD